MSTRCTINFTDGPRIEAKVYRHSDGYPDSKHGVLADLEAFFAAVKVDTTDTRFDDPPYLAAKFVVWQADQNARHYTPEKGWVQNKQLDFIGVGVMFENPTDIEYEYFVNCRQHDKEGNPSVTFKEVTYSGS